MVRMKHPQHGFMHAYNSNEVAYLRKFGWAPEDEGLKPEQTADAIKSEAEPEPRQKRKYVRKGV